MHAFVLAGILLSKIEQMHLVIITHIRAGQVLAVGTHREGGDGATTFRQSHHVDALGSGSIPDEDHRLKANLARGNLSAICTDAESNDIIAVAKLALSLLLALLDALLATAKDLLRACLCIKHDS